MTCGTATDWKEEKQKELRDAASPASPEQQKAHPPQALVWRRLVLSGPGTELKCVPFGCLLENKE